MPDTLTRTQRTHIRRAAGVLALCLLLASPYLGIPGWTAYVAATAIFTGIAATGVSMTLGYAGLLNLGAAFFFGLGGYGVGLSALFLGIPTVAGVLATAVAAAVVAVPLGILLVRLPRFYFAVATLGLAIALSGVIAALPSITGGASGLSGGGSLNFGAFTVASQTAWYLAALVAVVPTLLVVKGMTRGRRARGYAMLRQDELAASGLGIPVTRMKVAMFAMAAGVMAFGGGLIFALQGVVVPENAGVTQSVQLLGIAVIGGMASEYGAFAGAALLLWLQSLVSGFGTAELLIYGGVFLVVVFFFGDGLVGLWQLGWRALWVRLGQRLPERSQAHGSLMKAVRASAPATAAGSAMPAQRVVADAGSTARDLVVTGVRRAFGGVVAVDDASFTVPRGAVTALIGHNGAGKTTLLNIVSGFEPPDAGSVRLGEDRIDARSPEARARLGMMRSFQVARLIETRSVAENVLLGAEFCRPYTRLGSHAETYDAHRATREALELLGLTAVASQEARTLPGGQRKQVELARALVAQPALLILDEPGVGLDSKDIEKVAQVIAEVARGGAAVWIVDHNMDFVESIADQIMVMELGRLSVARPDEPRQADRAPPGMKGPKRPAPLTSEGRFPADTTQTRPGAGVPAGARAHESGSERGGGVLQVVSLRAGYGGLTVLHDVDLRVSAGEIVTISGPNGAGKSTLLNAIAGTVPAQAGEVWFEAQRVDALSSYRRVPLGIALVPEGRQIFESISVRANLDVAAFARGRARADHVHAERRERVLEMFPALRRRLRHMGGSLSGGEQQMLAIARAFMCEPRLLLLDEPMQGIAQAFVEELTELLQALAGSLTIIVAEPEPTLPLAQRVVELRMGRPRHSAQGAPVPRGSSLEGS